MSAREQVHEWIDRLPEGDVEVLRRLAENNDLAAVDDEPLTPSDLASIRAGEEDVRAGRVQSLDDFLSEQAP